ncbi:MAG: DUF2784 domain-containing protein [Desulfurivibrionaceae bacterium]|nr:DUF2784 domain-containing protein [Desulfurivibrionaceae bacterium]
MSYRLAANLVLVLHLAFVCFVVLGGFLVFRGPRLARLHLPVVFWAAAVEYLGWFCPLTPLENYLRRAAGQEGYPGGFIEHYLLPLLYPGELTQEVQIVLGTLVVVVNLAIYGRLLARMARIKRGR